ncbi:MAG TPA: sigma-54 dependent transcriptional regulator [Phycisphaerae bacterium]|nr:sigma-54 dependent transcriptional regulator [Phycisphaerae bacterium]HRW53128.1 sigma-54 dependent transcriptional regulator [Phycisphaerae bacterium]
MRSHQDTHAHDTATTADAQLRILLVDDDPLIRNSLRRVLRRDDVVHSQAADGESALLEITQRSPDYFAAAIIDLSMPGVDGYTVLLGLKRHSPNTQAIILTGRGTIQEAVRSTRNGADDFIEKPFDVQDLRDRVWSACSVWSRRTGARADAAIQGASPPRFITGNSPVMRSVLRNAERIASNDATVLIRGETGTGKSLLAHEIHRMSSRHDRPFIAVDLAAIGPQLIESELFGHARGAYTGAEDERDGLIRAAEGGTVFLDEAGELAPHLQVKLLHVLQERRLRPVGSDITHDIDVRFIAATNKDLEAAVRQGTFREDLYYRLNVMEITIPPLRDRREDLTRLIEHFVQKHQPSVGASVTLDESALRTLLAYDWPGNVREMDNVILRAMLLTHGDRVIESDLPPQVRIGAGLTIANDIATDTGDAADPRATGARPRPGTLAAYEVDAILAALRAAGGNRRRAAQILDIGAATLYRKLRKYGISE